MSLDLTRVVSQVGSMVNELKSGAAEKQQRLDYALSVLHSQAADTDILKEKIALARTTWLVARPVEGLDRHYEASLLPDEFTVIATDGSHIDVDRHRSTRCYLINIGSTILHYGALPHAVLDNSPILYTGDKDLVITPTTGKGREQPVEGNLLGIKRSVEECRRLTELVTELPTEGPALALLDGTLILWGLEAYPEFVIDSLLGKGLLHYFDEMRNISRRRELALASYISFPRSTDVVNALRVAICPHDHPDCDRYCLNQARECEAVAGVRDQALFATLLGQGERSALFASQSSIVSQRYGEHLVYFFYLRVDEEIARVEIPEWVATDERRLNLTHSLVIDQCRRGHGYPVALSEAHEQAVVTVADRENFWQLVESLLVEEHISGSDSAKSRSKRTRWI